MLRHQIRSYTELPSGTHQNSIIAELCQVVRITDRNYAELRRVVRIKS